MNFGSVSSVDVSASDTDVMTLPDTSVVASRACRRADDKKNEFDFMASISRRKKEVVQTAW